MLVLNCFWVALRFTFLLVYNNLIKFKSVEIKISLQNR